MTAIEKEVKKELPEHRVYEEIINSVHHLERKSFIYGVLTGVGVSFLLFFFGAAINSVTTNSKNSVDVSGKSRYRETPKTELVSDSADAAQRPGINTPTIDSLALELAREKRKKELRDKLQQVKGN